MSHRLIKAFQDQFVEAYIHPLMKEGGHINVHLRNFNPTRAEDVATQPIGQNGYVFTSVDDATRAPTISYESAISVTRKLEVSFSRRFVILPTGPKTENSGDIEKDRSNHTTR